MSENTILAGIILLVISGAAISWPFLMNRMNRQSNFQKKSSVVELEDSLHRFVTSVRDLDFDFDTGKIGEADYLEQRKLLIGRGVSALKRLDEALQEQKEVDDEIEALVDAYRQKKAI